MCIRDREVKHIGCKRFGIQYLLKGIYTHNGLLYFHTEIKNQSNVPFNRYWMPKRLQPICFTSQMCIRDRDIAVHEGIYFDMLEEMFTMVTGLYTRF